MILWDKFNFPFSIYKIGIPEFLFGMKIMLGEHMADRVLDVKKILSVL